MLLFILAANVLLFFFSLFFHNFTELTRDSKCWNLFFVHHRKKKGISKSNAERRLPAYCSNCFERRNCSKQREPHYSLKINGGFLLLFSWKWMTTLNMLLTILRLLCTVFLIWWSLHSLSHHPVIFCWSLYFSSV